MKASWTLWGGLVLLLLAGLLLCFPFMNNPLFFDDHNFFFTGNPEALLSGGATLYPRVWVYETLAITYVELGGKLLWLRLGNLLVHLGVVLALAVLVRNLLRDIDRRKGLPISAEVAAVLVAALFVMHPLAVFTQGYLIQRTILCSTLFSLLSLLVFWRGLAGSRLALWGSSLLFALAIYSKEHAVMLPAAAFMLLVLHYRSGFSLGLPLRNVLAVLFVQGVLALLVVLQLKGVIGTPYEILTAEVLRGEVDIPEEMLFPLSVINQCALFFKYIGLWLLPLPDAVSVDMRPAFPLSFSSWQVWGVVAFVGYMTGAAVLLWRGGAEGLLGLSLLLPAVLFFTEFSTVRLTEPFVLYRSYLWVPFLFIGVALGLRCLRPRVLLVLLLIFLPVFVALSLQRLKTFSHPLLIWREAADVYEAGPQGPGVLGGYRIYYNLGTEMKVIGFLPLALEALNRALELKPDYGWAVNNRGAVFLAMNNYSAAQADYERAVRLMPDEHVSWSGLAQALEAQGDHKQAEKARQVACMFSGQAGCGEVKAGELSTKD